MKVLTVLTLLSSLIHSAQSQAVAVRDESSTKAKNALPMPEVQENR
jgi:hypothetical protein